MGFGPCSNLAVPEALPIHTMDDLAAWARELDAEDIPAHCHQVSHVTGRYLEDHNVRPFAHIGVEGTLRSPRRLAMRI
ncbi:MAG: hypothetical protein R3C44_16900 [Chloroflexota bacterium]